MAESWSAAVSETRKEGVQSTLGPGGSGCRSAGSAAGQQRFVELAAAAEGPVHPHLACLAPPAALAVADLADVAHCCFLQGPAPATAPDLNFG